MRGNFHELVGQYNILQRRFELCDQHLQKAEVLLENHSGIYNFYVSKWKAISKLLQNPKDPCALEAIQQIKAQALEKKEWETLREIDFYLAIATQNSELFNKVYFGTPFSGYRKKMKWLWPDVVTPAADMIWHLQADVPNQDDALFNFEERNKEPKRIQMKTLLRECKSPLLCKLIEVVCRDFYRPITLGELHNELYANQFYHDESSPLKVKQLLKRVNSWFHTNGYSLTIRSVDSNVFIKSACPVDLIVERQVHVTDPNIQLINKFRDFYKENSFDGKTLAKVLHLSPRTAHRVIAVAKKKKLIYGGRGSGLKKYKFVA